MCTNSPQWHKNVSSVFGSTTQQFKWRRQPCIHWHTGDIQNTQPLLEHGSWPDSRCLPSRDRSWPCHWTGTPRVISALLTHEKNLQGVVKWKIPVPEQHEECDPLYVNKKQALKIGINIHVGQQMWEKEPGRRCKAASMVTFPAGPGPGVDWEWRRGFKILVDAILYYLKKIYGEHMFIHYIYNEKNRFFFFLRRKKCLWCQSSGL